MSSGTNKIVESIKSEAQEKADKIIQDAQAEIATINNDAEKTAEAEKNKILDNGKKQSDMKYQQIISEAKMNARRAELGAKEEVIEACKKVHAHSFIKRLPQGYDTLISANSGLSQGEKQLLTIARILLVLPEVIILDEATSSIDTRTEKKITEAFDQIMQGRTSFVIAHRLSTIQSADKILVMKNGNIIETGTHVELLKQNGFYKQLYNSQFEHLKNEHNSF